jgi:protoheme IX farnesyltransferase
MSITEIQIASSTTPPVASPTGVAESLSWWKDYLALTKPRILLMILLTVGIGMVAFAHRDLSALVAIHTLLGTTLIAASASVLNQWLEADQDALMMRTKNRPLPAGRLTSFEAGLFGWSIGLLGFAYLALATTWVATFVGLATWVAYVWIYTPMKQWSWWNTAVGTLPGALPVMIGWTAAGGGLYDVEGWVLTFVVILWQFPHFMAIAWLYRDQYAGAGYKMLTNVEPSGLAAGWHAVIPACILIPLSVFAVTPQSTITWILAVLAVVSCLSQMAASIRFLRDRNQQTARKLLHRSLIYLPSILLIVLVRSIL